MIETVSGTTLSVTDNHPLLINRDDEQVWVEAKDLKEGDFLVTRIGDNIYGTNDTLTAHEALYMGILDSGIVLDGKIDSNNTGFVKELNDANVDREKIEGLHKEYLEQTNGHIDGIHKDIRTAPKEVQEYYLKGLFAYSAFLQSDDEPSIILSKTENRFIEDVQIILKNMGITSYLDNVDDGLNDVYLLSVFGGDAKRLLNATGLIERVTELEGIEESIIPEDNIIEDEIVLILDDGEDATYCFTMEDTESFIAESVVNHNSSFAVHLSSITTQLGVITVWIDVEGTADNNRMEQLGVDVSKLFSIQAGEGRLKNKAELTVETVGEELEFYINLFNEKAPGVPILFIWDSLAQTPSKVEMEEDFGSQRIGLKSKSVTQLVNKITPLLSDTNTGLLVINQARDDLNAGMYGDKIKSTGGRAFEHSASLRIKVEKGAIGDLKQTDKDTGKDVYKGHVMRIETKKSKLSRPNQKAEADLLSDYELPDGTTINGLDLEHNIVQEALRVGLITKGAWRNYVTLDGEEIKLRKDEWVPLLKENRDLYLELFARVYQANFPEKYAPLNNENVDITQMDEFKALQSLYEQLGENSKEEATAPVEEAE